MDLFERAVRIEELADRAWCEGRVDLARAYLNAADDLLLAHLLVRAAVNAGA